MTQDEELSRAIQASLSSSYHDSAANEEADILPVEHSVREGGRYAVYYIRDHSGRLG